MSIENNVLVKLNNVGLKQSQKWLVQGVSLQVEKGKIVTLIGPNGSGKSTTAKIALGLLKNIEGEVEKFTNTKDRKGLLMAGADRAIRELMFIFKDDPIETPLEEATMSVWARMQLEE